MSYLNDVHTQILSTFQRQRSFPLQISQRKILLVGADLFLLNVALLFGFYVNLGVPSSSPFVAPNPVWFAAITFIWFGVASANDNYAVKQAAKVRSSVIKIVKSMIIMGMILILVPIFVPALWADWPRYLLVGSLGVTLLLLWRVFYAKILGRPNFKRRALIAGGNLAGRAIAEIIKEHEPGYDIIGYIGGESSEKEQGIQGVTRLGNWADLTTYVQDNGVSDIVLTSPNDVHNGHMQDVLTCFERGVRIVPMPELFEEITGRVPVEHIGKRWTGALPMDWDSKGLYLLLKRAMDIVIASIGLIFLAPFFPFFVLAIKLDSSGPVFYRPRRLGQGGKSIRLWKFRTMVANADCIGDPTFTSKSDSRITRVGRLLRLTHIDELPQFINVVTGDMSLVGPRPERHVPELEEGIPFYRARYAVKPGATGWALVNQGYAEGIDGTLIKLQYDLYYIKHQSLTLDILILCRSVIHMLTMGGQ